MPQKKLLIINNVGRVLLQKGEAQAARWSPPSKIDAFICAAISSTPSAWNSLTPSLCSR